MNEYGKTYNINGIKKENKVYIDANVLAILLEFEFSKKAPTDKETKEKIIKFKKDFQEIFGKCLAKGPKPWENKKNIIGETLGNDITYDPEMIACHYEEIKNLLERLGKLERYEDLMYLKDGEQWTVLRQQIGFLMTLANAAGLLSFEESNLQLYQRAENNPKLILRKKNEK